MGAYAQSIAAAHCVLGFATAHGDVRLYALAHHYLGFAYRAQGDYRQVLHCHTQTVVSFEGARRQERFGRVVLPAVNARAFLAWCHAELGTFTEGRARAEEGLQIAEAVAHPVSLITALWGGGLLALRQGDLHRALSLLERAMSLCQEVAVLGNFRQMAACLGEAYMLAGCVVDALVLLTQAMEQPMATTSVVY